MEHPKVKNFTIIAFYFRQYLATPCRKLDIVQSIYGQGLRSLLESLLFSVS